MKKFKITVNEADLKFNEENITVRNVLEEYNASSSSSMNLLVQITRGGAREILKIQDSIDLSVPGTERFEAFNESAAFFFYVNDKKFVTDKSSLPVNEILEIAGQFPSSDFKLSLLRGESENLVLSKEDEVNVQALLTPHFRADLKDRIYTISVDGLKHVLSSEKVTKEQILLVAGKTPTVNFELIQKLQDKRRLPITDGMWVDLSGEGAEKFVTIPCDQTEGA